ncbi:aquaporin [Ochrobactrum soli]|uniref:Aquaporin Z n=1 Tax=Ochrobactrum soli TaxID=2448455 RepID=A0A2P9HEC6_9HYPH|nr:aquaporin [[Ochrobactrum] soli]SPL62441.1 Aquaporin Z [[Ochrobactrum] soli]
MPEPVASSSQTSFFEIDASHSLFRRAFVEGVGTCFLTIAMVGAGLAVHSDTGADSIAAALVVSVSIAGALVGLIVSLGKVSGGHYNPLITIGQWLRGECSKECLIAYVFCQCLGGIMGALLSDTMFGEVHKAVQTIPAGGIVASEIVAAAGLMIVVFGCARSSKWETGPFAVGAWLVAAILATPSASYANPAVTIASVFAAGPVELSGWTAGIFIIAQSAGLLIGLAIIKVSFGSEFVLPAASRRSDRYQRGEHDAS